MAVAPHSPPIADAIGATAAGHYQAGLALLRQRRWREAQRAFQAVLHQHPRHVGALCNLAQVQLALGDPAPGLIAVDRALAERADVAEVHHLRAHLLQSLGRADEAIAAYERTLALEPAATDALHNLAALLLEQRQFGRALAPLERVLAGRDDFPEAHNNAGVAMLGLDRPEEALVHFDRATALRPGFADAHGNRGSALLSLGRLAEARAAFQEAIRLSPREGRFYLDLAGCHRFEAGEATLAAMRALASEPSGLSAQSRVELHFALGKALSDVGEPEASFRHYRQGNALKRVSVQYSEADTLRLMERVRSAFGGNHLRGAARTAASAPTPVFVVGMPRSGTTLVEQILASHKLVFGGGERPELHRAALRAVAGTAPAALFDALSSLPAAELRRLGTEYVAQMRVLAPGAAVVVDKMPGNFLYLGLIALALPEARVIHVHRDPLDTCVSCFCTLFSGDQPYTYNLGELGRYYRGYEGLMAHWRTALPDGMLIDVAYEDVVTDLPREARRMVGHCGLAWDARCLEFQNTQRSVRTASRAQVRQPIYRGAIGRAAQYAPMLGPLIGALQSAPARA